MAMKKKATVKKRTDTGSACIPLDSISLPCMVVDWLSGEVLLINQAGKIIAGPLKNISTLFGKDFRSGKAGIFEKVIYDKKGKARHLRIRCSKISRQNSRHLLLTFEDMTELDRAEKKIDAYQKQLRSDNNTRTTEIERMARELEKEGEEKNAAMKTSFKLAYNYFALMENFPAMIWKAKPDSNCDYVNATWTKFTGLSIKDSEGYGWMESIHPDERSLFKEKYLASLASRNPFSMEHRLRDSSGSYIWVSNICTPFTDIGNKFAGLIGVVFNIAERKETEHNDHISVEVLKVLTASSDQIETVKNMLAVLRQATGFTFTAIRLKEYLDFPYYATSGGSDYFIGREKDLCFSNNNGIPGLDCLCGDVIEGLCGKQYSSVTDHGTFFSNNFKEDLARITRIRKDRPVLRNGCLEEDFLSTMLIPLKSGESTVGLLQMCDLRPGLITPQLLQTMENLSRSIGISLTQKRMEQILRESEEKFSGIFYHAPDIMMITSCETGMILEVNEAFLAVTKLQREDLVDADLQHLPKGEGRFPKLELAGLLHAGQAVKKMNISFKNHMGGTSCFICSLEPLLINGKRSILTMMQDVTEINRHKDLYETIFLESTEGFWITDELGNITDINEAYHRITGFDTHELLGKKIWDLDPLLPCDRIREYYGAIEQKVTDSFQSPLKGKDGREILFDVVMKYLVREKIVFIFLRNITHWKQMEEQLIRSERLSAVGQLAAGVAHEFNNLMTIIRGNTGLAGAEDASKDDVKDSLRIINEQVDRGRAIVEKILTFSKTHKHLKEVCSIGDIIQDVYHLQRKQFDVENILFSFEDHSTGKVRVNKDQFRQVFIIMFSNAIHACVKRKDPVEGCAVKVGISEQSGFIEIVISDNGVGMEENVKKHIFTPFFSTKGGYATDGSEIAWNRVGFGYCIYNSS